MSDAIRSWMVAWCWFVIGFGAVLAASVVAPLSGPTMLFLDLIFWPIDGLPKAPMTAEAVFATGITGALTIGWGVLMLLVVRDPVLGQSAAAWRAMTIAMLVWFVVDSAVSWISGARVNVASNIVLVATYLVPVLSSGVLAMDRAVAQR